MKPWKTRSPEIAHLLNPAFCESTIYNVIFSYQKEAKKSLPFPLVYLILPILLHKNTRGRINSHTHLKVWIQNNPDVLIQFSIRARSLVKITNEAIEFLLQNQIINFNGSNLEIQKTLPSSKLKSCLDEEMQECFLKAEHVGKWFARSGAIENVYVAWGVKP